MIVKYACKNLIFNKHRTALILLIIAICSATLIFFSSLQYSSYQTAIRANTRLLLGSFQAQNKQYRDIRELRDVIIKDNKVLLKLNKIKNVEGATYRINTPAIISHNNRSKVVTVLGIIPSTEKTVSVIPKLIKKGSYLNKTLNEIILSQKLANYLKVDINDEIVLLSNDWNYSITASVFKLKGIFKTDVNQIDSFIAQIPIEILHQTLNIPTQYAHTLVILTKDHSKKTKATIQATLKEYLEKNKNAQLLSWEELMPGLKEAIELDMSSGWLFYLCLIVIVFFSILNSFLMSVMERQKEFGIVLSIGYTPFALIKIIIIEFILLMAGGLILGSLAASLAIYYYSNIGFYIPGSEELMKLWHIPARIYTRFLLPPFINAWLTIFLSSILSVLYPIIKAFNSVPITMIREE